MGVAECQTKDVNLSWGMLLSYVWPFPTAWNVAHQSPLSLRFLRQEYWSGCHFLLQRIFQIQGSNPGLLHRRQILYHWATREAQTQLNIWNSLNFLRQNFLWVTEFNWKIVTNLHLNTQNMLTIIYLMFKYRLKSGQNRQPLICFHGIV